MDYDLKIGLCRPIKDEFIEGWYYHTIETIELACGSSDPLEYDQPRHTIDDLEDVISHEVLHHVVQKVTGSISTSRKLENVAFKTVRRFPFLKTVKHGLNLQEGW